jgi:SAM-dependent methyltransferase
VSGVESEQLERLRREYENSLSWRLTRPIRAAGRLARARRTTPSTIGVAQPPPLDRVDPWLEQFYGERLSAIDAVCSQGASASHYALFRDLDDDVWALLLSQQYDAYPHIRELLPSMPEPALQEIWNGASGLDLARQTRSFYAELKASYERHSARPLSESNVLDFGCGWGRVTRYLLRDVVPGHLYGCDPVEGILEVCRASRIAARFARSAVMPERLPFEERFELAFAFSVFTHLSEAAHEHCLAALHQSMRPDGILIVTIRPAEYLSYSAAMRSHFEKHRAGAHSGFAEPRYLFVPHPIDPRHPQADGGQIEYGETVVTIAYVRERWSTWFELLDVNVQLADLHQVILTLRRK